MSAMQNFANLDQSVNFGADISDLIVSFVDTVVPVVQIEHVIRLAFLLSLE